jgi:hypothetical protein
LPAGYDDELATIFREMRRAAGASKEEIAGRLATTVEIVEALERGALLAMPEWGELTRIITTYTGQLGLDSRPILNRIQGQLGANRSDTESAAQAPTGPASPSAAQPPRARPGGPPMPPSAKPPEPPRKAADAPPPTASPLPRPPGATAAPRPSNSGAVRQPQAHTDMEWPPAPEPGKPELGKKPRGGMARVLKGFLNWAVLIGFVAVLGFGLWYAAMHPRMVWSTLDNLPEPIPRLMRSAWELVRPIENSKPGPQISDPDNRKSDKLP